MPDSPLSASPYEVLGVASDADEATLRLAYRRALRSAHPDTGGDVAQFHAVQLAWELVGTPDARALFDRGARGGASAASQSHEAWAPAAPKPRRDSRPLARTYGHPGGLSRERYLGLIREWAGRGVELADPYDPALVRSAPRDIRHVLADALAEEESARALSTLGIAYTVWHDLATDAAGRGLPPKLDHLVLGPTGLFAIQSEDWGGPVEMKRGELVGEVLDGERPVRALAARAKAIGRAARVKPTALLIVVPDEHAAESLELGGSNRGAVVALVRRSRLASAIREGLAGSAHLGGTEVMEVRSRLQAVVRFA
ncbi:molecular chaperone DnaJ [Agromyces badenianii]|uniref:Molecular chaperone DnaJ n=1 Tax=Agromyces badenianii TaxID=2080742 RepID=A0A2S0WUC2_9MICO|nr:DnaJ domain-containing protein [Agromyces badenianii]AWB94834.1 molecular chaperone DnaJ [Agromyces badenianii]PWC02880.1 molecular chaperone DnaJ [Agromyces badenianii]